jgi:large subunit ribosomal protein L19
MDRELLKNQEILREMIQEILEEKKQGMSAIDYIEKKFLKQNPTTDSQRNTIQVGDILRIGYNIPEGEKERIQYYEGLVIAKQNRGLGKTFTLRRSVQGIGIEQIFLVHSPKILSIVKKQSSKVRRAKLYFIRSLTGKAARLKAKK